jgi:hypothetical protein
VEQTAHFQGFDLPRITHQTEIRMVPQLEGKKRRCVAEGEWDLLLGGYCEDAGNQLVAGEGFEPSTFGL